MQDMGCEQNGPTILYEDNDRAKSQTENLLHYKKTKHIDVTYYYIRQIVSEDIVKLKKVNTVEQIADLMIKLLVKAQFGKLHAMLKMKATELVATTKT